MFLSLSYLYDLIPNNQTHLFPTPLFNPFACEVCFIIHITLINRQRSEGEARTRRAVDLAFHLLTYGTLMINNTSHSLWDRLQQKTLNQQFTNRLIEGLNCSPFEANAILDTSMRSLLLIWTPVDSKALETSTCYALGSKTPRLNLSKMPIWFACALPWMAGTTTGDPPRSGTVALRRHRLERITHQAYQQGDCLRLRICLPAV